MQSILSTRKSSCQAGLILPAQRDALYQLNQIEGTVITCPLNMSWDQVLHLHVMENIKIKRERRKCPCAAEFEFEFSKLLLEEPRRIRRYNRARAEETKSKVASDRTPKPARFVIF